MAQQTAVMAIAKAFRNWQREWDRYDKEGTNKPPSFDDFVKPFLQMEKEQIVKTWEDRVSKLPEPKGYMIDFTSAEEYYNDNYNK